MNNNDELKLKLMNMLTELEVHLGTLDPGSEEYHLTLENIGTVTKMIFELDAKSEEKSDRKKERIIKIALGVGPMILTAVGFIFHRRNLHDTFVFEETGSIPSTAGRHAVNDALKFPK